MDPLLATLVLVLLALLGARVSFSTERVPAGPRLLFRTGMHWLLLGWLLGPGRVGLVSAEALEGLRPLLAVGLGWVGLLFGMQLDRRHLRQFPPGYHLLALGQALLTFLLFSGAAWLALELVGLRSSLTVTLLVGAAATACISTPAGVAMVSANFLVRGNVRQLLFFVASLDGLVGIVALQTGYALFPPPEVLLDLPTLPAAVWVMVASGLGVVCAIIFLWLMRPRPGPEELVLFLMGMGALASGAALQLHLSPLFVTVVMGTVVANLAEDQQRIYQALHRWEKPIYVVLLLLAGAMLRFTTWWLVPLAFGYVVLRGGSKVLAGATLVRIVPLPFRPPRRLGLGLMPQGGISLAMAASLLLTYSGVPLEGEGMDGAETVFAVIVMGIVVSELVGPFFTTRLLRGAGEISPRVEQALAEGDEQKAEEEALRHNPGRTSDGGDPS